ncbi:hypothetical protein HI914_01234 [Erysiphe necator]|nr:hypothetical protein HI914_01234 [Erysiphe necator]
MSMRHLDKTNPAFANLSSTETQVAEDLRLQLPAWNNIELQVCLLKDSVVNDEGQSSPGLMWLFCHNPQENHKAFTSLSEWAQRKKLLATIERQSIDFAPQNSCTFSRLEVGGKFYPQFSAKT